MGDDGEKFGLWPGTYALCWEQGWVESFFRAVEAAEEWVVTMPPGEAAAMPAAGGGSLPPGPPQAMHGGGGRFWRPVLLDDFPTTTLYQRIARTHRQRAQATSAI